MSLQLFVTLKHQNFFVDKGKHPQPKQSKNQTYETLKTEITNAVKCVQTW